MKFAAAALLHQVAKPHVIALSLVKAFTFEMDESELNSMNDARERAAQKALQDVALKPEGYIVLAVDVVHLP